MKKYDPHDPEGQYDRESYDLNTYCAEEGMHVGKYGIYKNEEVERESGKSYEITFDWLDQPMTYNEAIKTQNLISNALHQLGYKVLVAIASAGEDNGTV